MWHHELAAEVHDLGAVACHGLDIRVGSHDQKPSVPDRNRLGPRLDFVDNELSWAIENTPASLNT